MPQCEILSKIVMQFQFQIPAQQYYNLVWINQTIEWNSNTQNISSKIYVYCWGDLKISWLEILLGKLFSLLINYFQYNKIGN